MQVRDGVHTADVSDLMRRMVKENLLKFDATPLFPERIAYTVPYKLSDTEAALYKLLIERLPETSLVSIAHRTNLAAFHRRRLQFKPAPGGMKVVSEPVS